MLACWPTPPLVRRDLFLDRVCSLSLSYATNTLIFSKRGFLQVSGVVGVAVAAGGGKSEGFCVYLRPVDVFRWNTTDETTVSRHVRKI